MRLYVARCILDLKSNPSLKRAGTVLQGESGGKKMRREGERNDSQFRQLQDSLGQRNRDQLIKHIISSSNGWKEEN